MAADGEILVKTGTDNTGFEKGSKDLVDSAKKTASELERVQKKLSTRYDRSAMEYVFGDPNKSANKFRKAITDAEKKLKDLESAGQWYGDAEFDAAARDLESLQQEVKRYKREISTGMTVDNPFQSGSVSADLYEAQAKLDRIISEGGGLGESEYDQAYKGLVKAQQAYKEYREDLIAAKEDSNRFAKVLNGLSKANHKLVGGVGKLSKALISVAKDGFSRLTNKAKSADKSLSGSLKTLTRYVFGVQSLFFLMNKIRDFGAEGFTNLAKQSDITKSSINILKASLLTLQNSIGAAFAPIFNAAAPALTLLINLVAKAANYVGMLIAALTGQETFKKAVGIQSDLVESMENTASATGDAAKAMEDYLSPLDEINKLGAETASSSAGSSGAVDFTGEMFEEVPIESNIKGLADKIKSYFQAEDWEGLGTYLADSFNKGLDKLYNVISWDNVGPKITKFTKKFTTVFNSFVDKLDAEKLGNTIGAGINTAVKSVNGFVDSIDWENLGGKFADAIKGIIDDVDGNEIGKLLNTKFRVAIKLLKGLVTNLPWGELGTELGEIVNGLFEDINPQDVADIISGVIDGALKLVVNFVKTTNWTDVLNSIVEVFKGLSNNSKVAIVFGALLALLTGAFGQISLSGTIIGAIGVVATFLISTLIEKIGEKLPELKEGLVNGLKTIIGEIKAEDFHKEIQTDILSKTSVAFSKPIQTVVETTVKLLKDKQFDPIKKAYDSVTSKKAKITVSTSNETAINNLANKWNSINSKKVQLSLSYVSVTTGASGKIVRALGLATGGIFKNGKWQPIEGYASGGYPQSARLFYANENGMPELVGRIGSSTAVMNNGQIVASVAAGVYQAVAAAFGQLYNYFALMSVSMAKIPEAIDRFNNMFPSVNVPVPAVVSGAVIPPQTIYNDKDIQDLISEIKKLRDLINGLNIYGNAPQTSNDNNYRFTAYVGRKVLFDEVISEGKIQQQITNKNPFDLK